MAPLPKKKPPTKKTTAKKAPPKKVDTPITKAKKGGKSKTKAAAAAPAAAEQVTAAVAVSSPIAATENKVPRIPVIKHAGVSDDQMFVWELTFALKTTMPAMGRRGLEIRGVNDRAGVLFNKHAGVQFRHCYTQEDEVERIIGFIRKHAPKEFLPPKWLSRVHA